MRIGVLSDTHGLLRSEALTRLEACGAILHAGDVGSVDVLERLGEIAPTTAVRGNVDRGPLAGRLPASELVELAGKRIYLIHDLEDLDLDPPAAGIDAVVFGHSHEPSTFEREGVLYFNPGSAGPKRFRLPVTMGIFRIRSGRIHTEWTRLAE